MRGFDYVSAEKRLWDVETLRLIGDIREHKGRLDVYLKERADSLKMTTESANQRAVETACAFEGINVPKSRIKALVTKKAEPQNDSERDIIGFYNAYTTVCSSFDSMPVRLRYVQQLHRELFYYARSVGGNFKKTNESITATDTFGNEIVLFTPATPYETPGAIDEICNKYNRAETDGTADPLLLIPLYILDFLSIRPFEEGNERVASLLISLLLFRADYNIGRYVSIDALILASRSEYFNALRKSQIGWNEGHEDATPFIKFFLGIVRDAYIEFESKIDLFGDKLSALETVRKAAQNAKSFTKAEMQELCPTLGKTSVESSLRRLTEQGVLKRYGSGRATNYTLAK